MTYANEDLERELELTNGDKVTLSFPTIGDELEIARTKADPNLMENIDVDVMTVASHIRSINGEPVSSLRVLLTRKGIREGLQPSAHPSSQIRLWRKSKGRIQVQKVQAESSNRHSSRK